MDPHAPRQHIDGGRLTRRSPAQRVSILVLMDAAPRRVWIDFQADAVHGRRSFNPCSLGCRSWAAMIIALDRSDLTTSMVSILVLLDAAPRPSLADCRSSFSPVIKPSLFQSLFSWMPPLGLAAHKRRTMTIRSRHRFQSLFSWITGLNHGHARSVSLGPRPESGCFNPCSAHGCRSWASADWSSGRRLWSMGFNPCSHGQPPFGISRSDGHR